MLLFLCEIHALLILYFEQSDFVSRRYMVQFVYRGCHGGRFRGSESPLGLSYVGFILFGPIYIFTFAVVTNKLVS